MSFALAYFAAFFMIAIAIGFLAFVYRKSGSLMPSDVAERLGAMLSIALIFAAGLLLFVTYRVDVGEGFTTPQGPSLTREELGAPAPDFAFTHVASQETGRLSDYTGDVVLINWWATWCAPCLEELPALNALQAKYAGDGLTVLTISDESRATLVDFEKDLPLETVSGYVEGGPELADPFRRTLQIRPTSYVIDRDGIIRDFVLGAQDLPTFERMISPYVREGVATR
jgi:peroxiredoxin